MIQRMKHQRGLALTELLIATFLLGTATVAITGLAVIGSRTSVEGERQNVGLGLANDEMEKIRLLGYDNVGYSAPYGGEPDGKIERSGNLNQNQQPYTVERKVELVDDPANGILRQGALNETTADYKKVTVIISWNAATGTPRNVSTTSYISKDALQRCVPGEYTCRGPDTSQEIVGACIPNEPCPDSGVCPDTVADNVADCPPGAQFCPECYSSNDCSAGNVCSNNTCVASAGACRSSTDCSGGQVCDDGQCTAACSDFNPCGSGEVCEELSGICVQSCTSDSCSCANGYSCNAATETCEPPPPPPSPSPSPSTSASPSASPSGSGSPTPSGSAGPTNSPGGSVGPSSSPGGPTPSTSPGGSVGPSGSPGGSVGPSGSPGGSGNPSPSDGGPQCGDGYVPVDGECVVDCRGNTAVCGGDSCSSDTGGCYCPSGDCDDPDWCGPEIDVTTDCSELEPIDPGCNYCFPGRMISIPEFKPAVPPNEQCQNSIDGVCGYRFEWAECAPCPSPSPTGVCTQNPDTPHGCDPCHRCNTSDITGEVLGCVYMCSNDEVCSAEGTCVKPTPSATPSPSPSPTPSPSNTGTPPPTPSIPPSPSNTTTPNP